MSSEEFAACVEACVQCAQACEHCADSCLGESNVAKMAKCIQTDRDCATLCWTAAALMSRGSQFSQEICRLCADACDVCADECEQHQHDHCQKCAEACRNCAQECRRMAGVTT